MSHKEIAQTIIDTLEANGIGSYIYCEATTSSVYVRFTDPRNSSIRIADHEGRSKYRYKWNVRTDKGFRKKYGTGWKKDRNIWRYYCIPSELDNMIQQIIKRQEFVKKWPVTYSYKTHKTSQTVPVEELPETTQNHSESAAEIW